jgi:hydroxyethylthiazole kinase-like uncharacterized protein yjeF
MAAVDKAAPEPVDVLVERAGFAVARAAHRMLGRAYGRRCVVIAGRGNNGNDGRVAARRLAAWGAHVQIVEPDIRRVPAADLVIDAAYGTGLSRPYDPPNPDGAPVLAVDIPSGLSGVTGLGTALTARRTVTFAALKPGQLIGEGPDKCGALELAGIGLQTLAEEAASMWVLDDEDLSMLPDRPRQGHKWQTAVLVVGGSEAMNGAPLMTAHGAMRAGAGYALVAVPGSPQGGGLPPGAQVGVGLPALEWANRAAESAARVRAAAIGPGLADRARTMDGATGPDTPVARFLLQTTVPAVVDADGLNALGDLEAVAAIVGRRGGPVVLTPHEGEYKRITGHAPGEDRIADVRTTARQTGAVVLLKGSPTIVAAPDGEVLISNSGLPRLATAGTGDVLSGIIAAFMARGLEPLPAAALAAHVHGRAASWGPREGLVATDLPDLVSEFLSEVAP